MSGPVRLSDLDPAGRAIVTALLRAARPHDEPVVPSVEGATDAPDRPGGSIASDIPPATGPTTRPNAGGPEARTTSARGVSVTGASPPPAGGEVAERPSRLTGS